MSSVTSGIVRDRVERTWRGRADDARFDLRVEGEHEDERWSLVKVTATRGPEEVKVWEESFHWPFGVERLRQALTAELRYRSPLRLWLNGEEVRNPTQRVLEAEAEWREGKVYLLLSHQHQGRNSHEGELPLWMGGITHPIRLPPPQIVIRNADGMQVIRRTIAVWQGRERLSAQDQAEMRENLEILANKLMADARNGDTKEGELPPKVLQPLGPGLTPAGAEEEPWDGSVLDIRRPSARLKLLGEWVARPLYARDESREGEHWYDVLPKLTGIGIEIERNGGTVTVRDRQSAEDALEDDEWVRDWLQAEHVGRRHDDEAMGIEVDGLRAVAEWREGKEGAGGLRAARTEDLQWAVIPYRDGDLQKLYPAEAAQRWLFLRRRVRDADERPTRAEAVAEVLWSRRGGGEDVPLEEQEWMYAKLLRTCRAWMGLKKDREQAKEG